MNPLAAFKSLEQEINVESLPITGKFPEWLNGTFIRNGPGKFEAGATQLKHWFDGPAMLHRFGIANGRVNYANRFLRTRAYQLPQENGKLSLREFGTDPCRTLFGRLFSVFDRNSATDNTNVNLTQIAGQFIAMTETPVPVRFDPDTLETLGVFEYDDELAGTTATAHPHYDPATGEIFNYTVVFGRKSTYNVYRIARGSTRRELLAALPVTRPAYMHSFAITPRYVVLVEFPVLYDPLGLLFGTKTVAESLTWTPDQPTRFQLISRADGSIKGVYEAPASFGFHHVNAFEQGDQVCIDLTGYDDDQIIRALYLDHLRSATFSFPASQLRRYTLPTTQARGDLPDYETISPSPVELPRIAYHGYNGHAYRYAYGMSSRPDRLHEFQNQLTKADVVERTARHWQVDHCFPGEPVFVAAPNADLGAEDQGVILSVVLDAQANRSFLVALEAESFEELARAEVPMALPYGFHGQYFGN
jgi:carotenoid cleavage dioxygenase-like enzyme